jgi:hypothetical protein
MIADFGQPEHLVKALNYLRAAHLRIGLLVNFNVPVIQDGLRRIIL